MVGKKKNYNNLVNHSLIIVNLFLTINNNNKKE